MADKHYIFDTEARRVLASKTLLDYYSTHREFYVQLARDLYRTLAVPEADPPQIGDVFVVLFSALKSNSTFIRDVLEHGVNLDRAANKWFSYFAWLIVLEDWRAITAKRQRRGQ